MSKAAKKPDVQSDTQSDAHDPNTHLSARELDPNVLQRKASTPESSVWVSASAGTGKTKVLTDRVLRLLLPRDNGAPGTQAHQILCLTFTKAAASEMALRISETLRKWAVAPEDELQEALKKLLGHAAKTHEIQAARRLFADVIDVPGGLKIMTIHAFCQSILGRFPLEAGINPNFTVLEEAQSKLLLQTARSRVFTNAETNKTAALAKALDHVASTINEDQFSNLLGAVAKELGQLGSLMTRYFDADGLYENLCQYLNVPAAKTPQDILSESLSDKTFAKDNLEKAQQILTRSSKKTDQGVAEKMGVFLNADEPTRAALWDEYKSAFLTTKNEPRANMATKESIERMAEITDIMATEADRILALTDHINATHSAMLTRDLLHLGREILDEYAALKTKQTALDFDDLILQTLKLLRAPSMSSWVHYKLDQGLEHILIDEAQDTNPEQWQIIEALCEEFFGNAEEDSQRTVFTVGDEKQSIYSFQRASPEEFARMQNDFREKAENARQAWYSVPMNISFRSTQSVLQAVDAVFESENARKGLGELPVQHTAFRRGQAGLVELWPVFENDESDVFDLWTPLKESSEIQSGQKKLSKHIAQTVRGWIDNKETLPSHDRPVRAGDIMILVRTRSSLVGHIARELKNLNIAVSGLDRMVLSEELAVQDLLAAANFTLQPLDDLNLACLLKSPLIGLSEDELFDLAYDREHESLSSRIESGTIKTYLSDLQRAAETLSPFEFFHHILQGPCPADKISGRRAIMARLGSDAMDPLDELLNLARNFEQNETASLQNFTRQIAAQDHEIKREQHGNADEVRIMTVHGSKGLQAPIVILPDTTSGAKNAPNRAEKRLLWPNQTGLDLPLYSPRKDMDCQAYQAAMATLDERLEEEQRRLLYVAMTRAEDRLYIGGALGNKKMPDGCWYPLIRAGLERVEDAEILDDETVRLTNPQIHDPDRKKAYSQTTGTKSEIPTWLREPAPQEKAASSIFRPSHMADTALSPLSAAGSQRFLRGNLTHKLLQLLPALPPETRENASRGFLQRYGSTLGSDIQENILKETLAVLDHPDFAMLFGPDSMAEVPITGHIEGKGLVSGQIDRLCVTDDTIRIIDYKTNRPPPADEKDIPEIYKTQMHTYAQILVQIYPDRKIKAALLWTDGAILMPLDLESL